LLYPIDFIRKSTGIPFQDVYNIMLRRGWTLGTAQWIPAMHAVIRLCHQAQFRVLERHWWLNRPDMVVSLVPHPYGASILHLGIHNLPPGVGSTGFSTPGTTAWRVPYRRSGGTRHGRSAQSRARTRLSRRRQRPKLHEAPVR
jgi:hypothetical protein